MVLESKKANKFSPMAKSPMAKKPKKEKAHLKEIDEFLVRGYRYAPYEELSVFSKFNQLTDEIKNFILQQNIEMPKIDSFKYAISFKVKCELFKTSEMVRKTMGIRTASIIIVKSEDDIYLGARRYDDDTFKCMVSSWDNLLANYLALLTTISLKAN